jgi:hypothetical protein
MMVLDWNSWREAIRRVKSLLASHQAAPRATPVDREHALLLEGEKL